MNWDFLLTLFATVASQCSEINFRTFLPVPRMVQDFLDCLAPHSGAGAIGTAERIFASAKAGAKVEVCVIFFASMPCG